MTNPATLPSNDKALRESLTTEDIGPGGVMPRETFDEFYELAVNEARLLNMVRTEQVGSEKTRIPKIGVGERQRRGQAEGAQGARATVESQQVDIDCKKSSVSWGLSKELIENNPAGEGLADTILDLMTQQFSADTQELAITGDEAAATGDSDLDDFRQQNDGFLTLAASGGMPNYVHEDGSGTSQPVNNALFDSMIDMMPDKYRARDPVFMMSDSQLQSYRSFLTSNYDAAGFQVLMGDNDVTPFSYDVVGMPYWPDDQVLFTEPQNLIYAIFRDVEVDVLQDSDEIAEKDLYAKYYIRVKDDFAIENVDAGVLGTSVATS